MSNAIARIESSAIAVQSLADMQQIGKLFAASGMFLDVRSEAQAVVKIMAGAELGLSPFAAMAELHVIKSKVTLSAGLLAKKVKASGKYNYRVVEHSDKVCSIDFFEVGEKIGNETFTIEQARKAGVQNLDKFPKNMLFARAISNGVRFYCPDVTGEIGVYTPGEPDAPIDSDNGVIEVEVEAEQPNEVRHSILEEIQTVALDINADLSKALKHLKVETLADLSIEQATKLLGQLQARRDAQAKSHPEPKPDDTINQGVPVVRGASLDDWLCTQQSGSRSLALNVLSAWGKAGEVLGLNDDDLREEMAAICEGITSRKDLSQEQAQEFIGYLRAAIEKKGKRND